MYKRILVAVDGSANSTHALDHAICLAKALSATLRVVHAIDLGMVSLGMELGMDGDALLETRHARGEVILASACDRVQANGLAADARLLETAAPSQHIAGVIADEAARWPADLIVLGSRGHKVMERLLLGSVAEGLARLSAIPVLLIPLQA